MYFITSSGVFSFIGERTTAGAIELMVTPFVATSFAVAFTKPIIAAFEVLYGAIFGLPSLPEIDATCMIRPYSALIMCGRTAAFI